MTERVGFLLGAVERLHCGFAGALEFDRFGAFYPDGVRNLGIDRSGVDVMLFE